jgi:uncharacterized membrane protein YbhN (UPF0104 family)
MDSSNLKLDYIFDNKLQFFLYLILFLPIHFFLSLKFCKLFSNFKKISIMNSIKVNLIAFTYNLILPAKTGDFLRFNFLGLKIKNKKKIFNFNLIEKIISLLTLIFLIILSTILTKNYYLNFVIEIILKYKFYFLFLIFLIIFIFFIYFKKFLSFLFLKNSIPFQKLFLLDIIIWSISFLQIFCAIKILKIDINYFETIFIFGVSIIAGLIPISLGGFGVRDFMILNLMNLNSLNNDMVLLLIFFNLRYLIPIFLGILISINYSRNRK